MFDTKKPKIYNDYVCKTRIEGVMAKKEVAILDIGSQKLTILVGSRDVNNSINVRCTYQENYEGFMDGEFIEPKNLEKAISSCILGASKILGKEITSLVVGVPTEFTFCACKNVTKTYEKQRRFTESDIESLYALAEMKVKTHTVISQDSIYFVLGENNKVSNPLGQVDSKISAFLSFVLAENGFLSTISKILLRSGVENFDFVSSVYAQSQYLFDDDERERYALLVDCGYITTTVALIRGNGLLNLTSFSMGGGHIAGDLCTCLKIPFNSAENLLKKVVLTIEPDENDTYDILINHNLVPISMRVANAIVESRIEVIGKAIKQCFSSWAYNFPDFIPIHLTGGGISFIKGGKDVLANCLNRNVEIVSLPSSLTSKTNFSSSMAVLNYALNH